MGALFALILTVPLRNFHNYIAVLDPDIWWHLRTGSWIARNHALPHTSLFGVHANEQPWIAYSWVFELLVSRSYHSMGLLGLPVMLALLESMVVFGVFLVLLQLSQRFWIALFFTVACVSAIYPFLSPRPALFSMMCLMVEMVLITEARRTTSLKPLYWMPLLFCVWANLHIQFVYGLVLFGVLLVAELLTDLLRRKSPSIKYQSGLPSRWPMLALLLLLSVVATCIGPYWGKIYGTIFNYANNTSQFEQIEELAAPAFRTAANYFELLLLLVAVYVAGWKRTFDLFRICALVLAAFLAFRAARDAWFLAILAVALIAEGLRSEERSDEQLSLKGALKFAGVAVAGLLVSFAIASPRLKHSTLIAAINTQYPLHAADFVRQQHLSGPMYNTLNWGGFLIFDLPEHPVTIDGRTDVYGPDHISRAILTLNGRAWERDPDLANANFVLIEKELPLSYILASHPDFQLGYADHIAAVYVRKSAPPPLGTPAN